MGYASLLYDYPNSVNFDFAVAFISTLHTQDTCYTKTPEFDDFWTFTDITVTTTATSTFQSHVATDPGNTPEVSDVLRVMDMDFSNVMSDQVCVNYPSQIQVSDGNLDELGDVSMGQDYSAGAYECYSSEWVPDFATSLTVTEFDEETEEETVTVTTCDDEFVMWSLVENHSFSTSLVYFDAETGDFYIGENLVDDVDTGTYECTLKATTRSGHSTAVSFNVEVTSGSDEPASDWC